MLLLSVVIHALGAMMQQLNVVEGLNCSGISCTKDCSLYSQDGPTYYDKLLHEQQAIEYSRTDIVLLCCKMKCRESCVTSLNEIIPNGETWMNPDDPCTTHVCNNGIISNHTSACSGLPCSSEFHVYRDDTCCPSCEASWASFCPEVEDCDIACQYNFKRDNQRGCDFCSCAGKSVDSTTSSTSTTAAYDSTLIDDETKTTRTVKFYLYFDPTDGATKNLLIGITITCFVILVICLAAIGWYFHRKVYRKVPLLSLSNSSP